MGIEFKANGGIKLGNINTFNNIKNSATNVFKEQFYDDIEDIDYSKYEDVNYNVINLEEGKENVEENANKGILSTIWSYAATAVSSFSWGVLEVVENVGDGIIMLSGAQSAAIVSIADCILGTDLADQIKQTTSDIISYDWTEAGYDAQMKFMGVDDDIAHGKVHQYAGAVGTMAGYTAMTLIPGGVAVTAATGALSAAGSASEKAFNSGATFEEALVVSAASAAVGATAGYGLNKIGKMVQGATSLRGALGYTGLGATMGTVEPVANSLAEYYTYGKDMVDANGNLLYNGFGDYYVDSGAALNTVIGGAVGGISTGIQGVRRYRNRNFDEVVSTNISDSDNIEINNNKHANEISFETDLDTTTKYNLELKSSLESKISEIGYDTQGMDLEKMKTDFPDLYNEILDERFALYNSRPTNNPCVPIKTALDSEGKVFYPPGEGFVLDSQGNPILTETTLKSGSKFDRYGLENGRFIGLQDESGNFATYEQRSLAYTQESNTAYNQYEVVKDISTDSLTQKYRSLSLEDKQEVLEYMSKQGVPIEKDNAGNIVLKVTKGEIAPAYGLKGGGIQSALPISIEMLKKWGFVK